MRAESRRFVISILVQMLMSVAVVRPGMVPFYDGSLPAAHLPGWLVDVLTVAWWYALAWNITAALEVFVWRRIFGAGSGGMPRQRKLLTDMAGILVYAVVTGIIAVKVFDHPVTALFATSGIIAIVLGLALQNTLGDLFAGLALNIERPFKAGDWVSLDNGVQGLVLVTNWRATHLRTRTADVLVVPNSVIAKGRLTNHALPAKAHLANVEVPLLYGFDDAEMEAVLKEAALGVAGVLSDPAPIILMHEMKPGVVVWRVYFFLDDFARLVVLRGQVTRAVYAALGQRGLGRYLPRNDLWLRNAAEFAERTDA